MVDGARVMGDIDAANDDFAAMRAVERGKATQERRLARAIRPHKGDNGALVDRKGNVKQRALVRIVKIQAFDFDHFHGKHPPRFISG